MLSLFSTALQELDYRNRGELQPSSIFLLSSRLRFAGDFWFQFPGLAGIVISHC